MRDDSRKWDLPPDFGQPLAGAGVTVTRIAPQRQTLISAPDALARHPGALGWPDIARGDSYGLCLRRDRLLEVNGPARAEGWDGTEAISDISDGLTVFQIEGENALPLCLRGAELSLEQPSRSVLRAGFGFELLLYRWEGALRLHVARGHAQALWQTLEAHIAGM
ncbi:MAG: hypothetical protein AB7S99_01545 [Pseudodonghicola sp.]